MEGQAAELQRSGLKLPVDRSNKRATVHCNYRAVLPIAELLTREYPEHVDAAAEGTEGECDPEDAARKIDRRQPGGGTGKSHEKEQQKEGTAEGVGGLLRCLNPKQKSLEQAVVDHPAAGVEPVVTVSFHTPPRPSILQTERDFYACRPSSGGFGGTFVSPSSSGQHPGNDGSPCESPMSSTPSWSVGASIKALGKHAVATRLAAARSNAFESASSERLPRHGAYSPSTKARTREKFHRFSECFSSSVEAPGNVLSAGIGIENIRPTTGRGQSAAIEASSKDNFRVVASAAHKEPPPPIRWGQFTSSAGVSSATLSSSEAEVERRKGKKKKNKKNSGSKAHEQRLAALSEPNFFSSAV